MVPRTAVLVAVSLTTLVTGCASSQPNDRGHQVAIGVRPVAAADAVAPPSVTMLNVPNLPVTGSSCREVPVTANLSWGPNQDIAAVTIQVWRDIDYIDTDQLTPHQPKAGADGFYFYCPRLDGVGTFRAGPAVIDYYDTTTYDQSVTDASTTKTFLIRQSSLARVSATRSGRYVTAQGRVSLYNIAQGRWAYAKGATVTLQERARTATSWATVARARISQRTGVATFPRRYAPRAAYWRVLFADTYWTWGADSVAVLT